MSVCSMCEQEPATVTEGWPAPVCGDCDRWLNGLSADLLLIEVENPEVAEAARRVDEVLRALDGNA